ncbi:MAG TPA: hypothetical protein PKY77_09650 [Phycisphaerae bacterium]|nr:hypothetical protein [Phycisphaerae bacterium]HRY68179.1 hypothetical protein [Phycisphaerae bacterium]HSA27075.1 hypothetical protein [Phycisphaerae bacterium]
MASISLIFVILLLAIVVIVVLAILRLRRGQTVSVPVCGNCSYPVRGLPTFTCPECGSDLREVGIVTPTTRRPLPPLVLAIIWTLILPVPAMVVSVVVIGVVPLVQETTMNVHYLAPSSGAYAGLDLESHSQNTVGSGIPIRPYELVFALRMNPGPAGDMKTSTMRMDVSSNRCSYLDAAGKPVEGSTGLSAETLRAWMAAAGVDTKKPQVQVEIAEIMSTIQSLLAGTMPSTGSIPFTNRGGGTSSNTSPPRWLVPSLGGFWLLVWLLGIIRIVWKRKPLPV